MSRSRIAALTVATALLVGGAQAANAGASYHEMKVSEVHFDTMGDGDFVELQMYSAGQNFVGGHFIRHYDATGAPLQEFQITGNVTNGDSQRTILIGNTAVNGDDFETSNLDLQAVGGAVCFLDSLGNPPPTDIGLTDVGIDCVSWGTFDGTFTDGTPSPVGTNAAPGGMSNGQSLTRSLARGCPTFLEAADDTASSSADFTVTGPTPRANSVTPTEVACPSAPAKKKCKKKKKGKGKAAAAAKKKKCKKKKKKK